MVEFPSRIENVLLEKSRIVDSALIKIIETYVSSDLKDAVLHLIKAGGKRIRPAITLLCTEALGENPEYALNPASSIELVHTASLIHDDILDGGTVRRRKRAVHLKWDLATGVLAGDILLSLAIKSLILGSSKISIKGMKLAYISDGLVENFNDFARTWITMCDGKKLDTFKGFKRLADDKVYEIIYKKTAVLFELAAKIGASYAGADFREVNAFASYGKNTGMAFQIQDDILNLISSENVLGKDVGFDIREGKKTLPISYILNNGQRKERQFILNMLGKRNITQSEIERVIGVLEKNGCINYARECASKFIEKACEELDIIPESKSKKILMNIPSYVVARVK